MKFTLLLSFLLIQTAIFGQNRIPAKPFVKSPTETKWIYPNTNHIAYQYNRVEIGVELPDNIQQKVDYFLTTDDSTKGINPFLAWQLDVTATFTHLETGDQFESDAFYYQNFTRDTSHADFRKWGWQSLPTPYPMRIRFAPPKIGLWTCKIEIKTKTKKIKAEPIQFVVQSSENEGYITVGKSKRFFTLNGKTYFPSGQNLVAPRCEFCYVNSAKTLPQESREPAKQALESWILDPTGVKSFLMFQSHIKSLAANGGNYFRQLLLPQNQDIEWEKLGNYYGRMNRAWEIDEQFFMCEAADLKMQLNLQIQFALENNDKRIFWNWKVDENDKRHCDRNHPCANPYNREIATTDNDDPNTFFSDATAKKFFKQKLRYIISRWGYSTSLAVLGLVSEIQTPCTAPEICVSWSKEMGRYLKKDLKINQLLTPSFLGIYHDPENYEHPILKDTLYDMSTLNWYSVSPAKFESEVGFVDRFLTDFDQPFFFGEIGNSDLYPCDTARIEWVRDAWMSAFSGNAGTGMNWDEPFDDELRKHLGDIQHFVAGIDFDNAGNPWTTRRVISDNRSAETVFLQSPDANYAVGVISNRYYNWYLNGDTTVVKNGEKVCDNRVPNDPGFDPNPADGRSVWERTYAERPNNYIDQVDNNSLKDSAVTYTPFKAFDYQTNEHYRLRLYGMQRGNYTILFYNALTMEFLGAETNWGPNVNLEYPEMGLSSGLIAFKLYRNRAGNIPDQEKAKEPFVLTQESIIEQSDYIHIITNQYALYIDKNTRVAHFGLTTSSVAPVVTISLYKANNELLIRQNVADTYLTFKTGKLDDQTYMINVMINGEEHTHQVSFAK